MKINELKNNAMDTAISRILPHHIRNTEIFPDKFSQFDRLVLSYFESSANSEEFVDSVAHDERLLAEFSGYEMIACWSRYYRSIVKNYLRATCECFTTWSEAGSVTVESNDFSVQISNGYGDGETFVAIGESSQNLSRFFPVLRTVVDGSFDILSCDCGGSAISHCDGRFHVFSGSGIVIFEKVEG